MASQELLADPFFDLNPDLFTQIDSLIEQSQETQPTTSRFPQPLSQLEFKKVVKSRIPKSTQKTSLWAVAIFKEWRQWRNFLEESKKDEHWPIPPLETTDYKSLDYWLARFIVEVRKQDTGEYPAGTLTSIAAGLQRHIRDEIGHIDVWLLKKADLNFKNFRDALDARRKVLFAAGIGTTPVQADPVTLSDEEQLWEKGIFNLTTAHGLSYAAYFYNCKAFGFRCKDEHIDLMAKQYCFGTTENGVQYIQYNGKLAKNVTGANDSKATPRVVKQLAQPNNPRCIVALFQKYLSLIPASGKFYRRPLESDKKIVFSTQTIGINKLAGLLTHMYELAGINADNRNITGHSGKVTCCTRLYEADFDEQAITSRSGHRSTAVRAYKRPSEALLQRISDTLQPPMPKMPSCTATTATQDLKDSICEPTTSTGNPTCTPTPISDAGDMKPIDSNMLVIHVPDSISRVTLIKNGKKFTLEI